MKESAQDLFKFLTFRATTEDYDRFGKPHFLLGLLTTWLVGIARNWDFPSAPWFAKLGLASIAYIFILSPVLWLFLRPVSHSRPSLMKVLTVVSLTAAPGLIYGIPVEMFMDTASAQGANTTFLALVATWRVALALHFFCRGCKNSWPISASVLLVPICLIIITLVITGRAGYVIEVMGGMNRNEPARSQTDDIVASLFCFSGPGLVVGGLIYIGAITHLRFMRKWEKGSGKG